MMLHCSLGCKMFAICINSPKVIHIIKKLLNNVPYSKYLGGESYSYGGGFSDRHWNRFRGSIQFQLYSVEYFGHKPSTGAVSNGNQYPVVNEAVRQLISTGPMCRYAVDLLPMMKVMTGNMRDQLRLDEARHCNLERILQGMAFIVSKHEVKDNFQFVLIGRFRNELAQKLITLTTKTLQVHNFN
ncbi:fatty-acid amide hydrolase 2 [Caerostris extrusa]|uniref:Fatty-acid amide hydrolase 2 n=1 Tax=Caerostris extrusa TaxID=172846 RepID=A0AAV4S5F9_CAEEX|nr:fatty-acid amide hydrolase 2 [Caerostris extrusa]